MRYKSLIILLLSPFVSFKSFGQISQVQIARNTVGKLQAAIAAGKDKNQQLSIIGEGIKAVESAQNDRRTKNWPETWSIKGYLSSYIAIIDEDETNSDKYFNLAQESIATATKLDRYQDNAKLIEATNINLIVKKQDNGNKAYLNNEFSSALVLLKEVSDFYPKDTATAINAGIAAQNIQSYEDALTYLKRAKDNGAKNPILFQALAKIYTSKFENELALKTLQDGIRINPYNRFLTYDYINLLLDTEKYTQASEVIEGTLKGETKNKLLYFLYGYLHQLNGNISTAELAYKKAIALDPNYFNALYQMGLAYADKANEALKSNKETEKQNFVSYINRSEYALLQAHEINPNDRPTVQLLIEIYSRKNRLDKVQDLKRKLQEF